MSSKTKIHIQKKIKLLLLCVLLPVTSLVFANPFSSTEKPKNLGKPMNSQENDFAPTISPDGRFIIFNSNRNGKYQDLFISFNKDGEWSTPQPLAACNSPYNDETPFLSADGTLLLFSSDRDGSIEMPRDAQNRVRVSFDIYWSKLEKGNWSKPQPVPGIVNTMHHEKTPSMSNDGKTLYYTTWQFGNLKETRIAKAVFENNSFSKKSLLPAPFNSGYIDVALIPAEDLGGFFFSSNRPDSFGGWDLYFVACKNNTFGKPIHLGEHINSKANELFLTRIDQRFFICSNRDDSIGKFDLYASYIFQKDTSFETRAIHFDFNSCKIKEESFAYLDALSMFLKKHPQIRLQIIGHTDLHGSEEFNLELSQKRATAVKDYLVSKGVQHSRLSLYGAGKSKPVINKTGEGFDEKNRRTEFKLIK